MSTDLHPINQLHAAGAPEFVNADAQSLLSAGIAKFEELTGRQLSPSQVEMYLLETIAFMLAVRGAEEQLSLESNAVAYAQGEWLDVMGADRNTPRLAALNATTTIRFETGAPLAAALAIPAGTRVSDSAALVTFLTLEAASIGAGQSQVEVKAQASETGIYANGFPASTIASLVDTIPGVTAAANISETGGGAEREDDDRYRARVAGAFERIGDGLSRERYVEDVLGWNPRCIAVAVTRPEPGHVNIYPLMDTGAANAEELASLQGVFDASTIHQGDFIQVIAPPPHEFSFTLALTVTDAAAAVPAEAAVQAVLDKWRTRFGGFVAPGELVKAAQAVSGIVDADTPDLAVAAVAGTAWRSCTGFNTTVEVV